MPQLLSYQGRIAVSGQNFTGTGKFKFALVEPIGGNPNTVNTLWNYNGSAAVNGADPGGDGIETTVQGGLYSLLLGDTSIGMAPVPVTAFQEHSDVRLRVWFDDGTHGFQQLSPDKRIGAVGYALSAGVADESITEVKLHRDSVTADKIKNGEVIAGKLGVGAVAAGNIQTGAIGSLQIAAGAIGTSQIAAEAITSGQLAPEVIASLGGTLQQVGLPALTAMEVIKARDAVAVTKDAANNVKLIPASAASGTRSAFYGFAKTGAAVGETVTVHQFGPLSGFAGLVGGAGYYLGPTDGTISPSLPTGNLAHVYVGSALGADTLFVDPFGVTKRWVTSNYWGNGTDGSLVTTGNESFPSTLDGEVVVKHFTNLTINAGHTVTTQTRCRGLVIYVDGNCTINGTLTMTARGANVDPTPSNCIAPTGIRIVRKKSGGIDVLTASDVGGIGTNGVGESWRNAEALQPGVNNDGKIYTIARTGGAGAGGRNTKGAGSPGLPNADGMGGGGSGGWDQPGYVTDYSGSGSGGTCYSGGAGGGGLWSTGWAGFGGNGGANGGAGGSGAGGASFVGGGGAGNPGGSSGDASGIGESGTGGLLVLFVRGNLVVGSAGKITANGSRGGDRYSSGGGGSGGGRVIVLYAGNISNTGTVDAIGGNGGVDGAGVGTAGGNGGNGFKTIEQIDP